MMDLYTFRNDYYGFFDWLKRIRKIKLRYYLLCNNRGSGLIELHFEDFKTVKNCYLQYLQFLLTLNNIEKKFVKSYVSHHYPSREISCQVDINDLIKKWSRVLFEKPGPVTIKKLTSKEVGRAIEEARHVSCRSRKEIADILKIDVETLKSYEQGRRKIPFIIFYQLEQILEIDI